MSKSKGAPLPRPQWKLLVDWNRDGDFTDAKEDITDYVMEWHWKLGMSAPYQEIGDEAEADFVLDNSTGIFSPERTGPYSGLMDSQTPVVVQSIFNGVTVTHYAGWIDTILPTPGTRVPRRATMNCYGIKRKLEESKVYLELMEDVTADEVLDAILQQINISPANGAGNWILGVTNFSELGQKTWLADTSDFWTLQAGLQTLAFVGDTWGDGVMAMEAIADVVSAERGRAFQGRDGKYVLWNRAEMQTNVDVVMDITDTTFETMDYRFGEHLANVVKIMVTPRTIAANELLWELEDPFILKSGKDDPRKVIRATFKATEDGTKIAGRNVRRPSAAAGTITGTWLPRLYMLFEADARSAKITMGDMRKIKFRESRRIHINTMQIYGEKITTWKQQELETSDVASMARRGRHEYTVPGGLLDDVDFAEQVISYELARRKDPRGEVFSITVRNKNNSNLNHMLNRTMGDRISIAETHTGHDAEYFIVGEEHRLYKGTIDHTTTWYLETASALAVWVLGEAGHSELGVTTYLGL